MVRVIFEALLAVTVAALSCVDVVSFRRTRPLRRGQRSPALPMNGSPRSSPTTHLACGAGVLMAGLGLSWARDGPGGHARMLIVLVLIGAGGLVAVTGWWARVVGVIADGSEFTIRYRKSREFGAPWARCLELRAPRTPFAGWRVVSSNGTRSLMPSDLLGNEGVLNLLIKRAGLRFDGRAWHRPA